MKSREEKFEELKFKWYNKGYKDGYNEAKKEMSRKLKSLRWDRSS